MKLPIKSKTALQAFALLLMSSLTTLFGRVAAIAEPGYTCNGWQDCVYFGITDWNKLVHVMITGATTALVLLVTSTAWREHRKDPLLLPLANVLCILFFGQVLVGAKLVASSFPVHLVILHSMSAILYWIALLGFTSVAIWQASLKNPIPDQESKIPAGVGGQRVADFIKLTKPLIVSLLLMTTLAGLVAGQKGWPPLPLIFWTMLGGTLAASGSSALNQYIDRDLDKKMKRTARRPLPGGRLMPAEGLAFGLALCLASYYIMACFVNLLAALLSLSGVIYYVLVYSLWLKKSTAQNIVIGGGAGAIPPMVGWAAATGSLSLGAWILFAIVFFWTPPHFWALAIVRKKDYERAGVPMLPAVMGEKVTSNRILIYSVELVAVSLLLPLLNLAGLIYFFAALILGGVLIYLAWMVRKVGGNRLTWRMYKMSSLYLAFIFLAIMVDALI